MGMTDETELVVDHVDVAYGRVQVLRDISVKVGDKEIVTIAGANGAGKSTLLKTIAGLMKPSEGRITLDGFRIDGTPAHSVAIRGLRLIAEGGRVFPNMSVADNLAMGAYLVRSEADKKSGVEDALHLFPDLQTKLKEPARSLSGGQRQMLAVAIGLACRPKCSLWMSPLAGCHPSWWAT